MPDHANPAINIFLADYADSQQAHDIGWLLNEYAKDPMGGGAALPGEITANLATELGKRPYAFTVLCYVDGEPAGLINCFESFSSFYCKPLVNVHDVAIVKECRGMQLSQKMLGLVEEEALRRGACKLTLEVLSGNRVAQGAYIKYGFEAYKLSPEVGSAQFWQKLL